MDSRRQGACFGVMVLFRKKAGLHMGRLFFAYLHPRCTHAMVHSFFPVKKNGAMNKIMGLVLAIVVFGASAWAQPAPQAAHKVVIQLSSSDTLTWKGLMNNLRNLKAGWGDSVLIEVVAHGPGLELLMHSKSTQHPAIQRFKAMGIPFYACENTMHEKNIPKDAILPEATFVRMGIGHVILRQEAGWSYIKAGF